MGVWTSFIIKQSLVASGQKTGICTMFTSRAASICRGNRGKLDPSTQRSSYDLLMGLVCLSTRPYLPSLFSCLQRRAMASKPRPLHQQVWLQSAEHLQEWGCLTASDTNNEIFLTKSKSRNLRQKNQKCNDLEFGPLKHCDKD